MRDDWQPWRLAVGIAAALLLPNGSASAAESAFFKGAGTFTCGEFANQYRAAPEFVESNYFSWAQGFMSALNGQEISKSGNSINLGATSLYAQKAKLRAYCDSHPLAEYLEAVMDLYFSFPMNTPVHPPK